MSNAEYRMSKVVMRTSSPFGKLRAALRQAQGDARYPVTSLPFGTPQPHLPQIVVATDFYITSSLRHVIPEFQRNEMWQRRACPVARGERKECRTPNAERRISNVEGGNASVITPFDKLRAALRQAQGGASTSSGQRFGKLRAAPVTPSRHHVFAQSRLHRGAKFLGFAEGGKEHDITITPIQNGKCQILAFLGESLLGERKECRMSNIECRMLNVESRDDSTSL